jgi:hypothetical protein
MMSEYDAERDSTVTMNLHYALRWVVRAWNHDVLNFTIHACFRKSSIFSSSNSNLPLEPPPNLTSLYNDVRDRGNIKDMMDIQNFLSPPDEDMNVVEEGEEENTLAMVITHHTGITISAEEDDVEENIDIPILPPPTYDQAL